MSQLINSLQMSIGNDNFSGHTTISNGFYSIEAHLSRFRDIEPYNILYSSWILEKEEYQKRLSTVAMTYQTFSLHDASHSETILKQLVHFLGEDRIRQLSPTDAWLILECAYCHDLGMVVTARDLYNKLVHMDGEELDEFSKNISESTDYAVRASWSYLEPLFRHGQQMENPAAIEHIWKEGNAEKNRNLRNLTDTYRKNPLMWPMHFTKAFMCLIQEYCRPKHGKMSFQMIEREADEKSYEGLIPIRIRHIIADIAEMHTDDPKNIIRKLSYEIEGIGSDYAHPRFVAELIRIGDLLDMDNNRFNQYQLAVAGSQSYASFAHQLKHRSLKDFLITPEKIEITSDFKTEDALYLIRGNGFREFIESVEEKAVNDINSISGGEKDLAVRLCLKGYKEMSVWLKMLHNELGFFSQNWFQIVPDGFSGSCAYYELKNPLFNGKEMENDLIDLRYHITAKRASEIIQGSGLYENVFTAFIREIVQNSMDAIKRKVYDDLNRKSKRFRTPLEFYRYISRDLKHLEIQIKCEKDTDRGSMVFEIRDRGIGISNKRLQRMQHIGDFKDYNISKQAGDMPAWWKPTGSFGIGMQTIFYFSNKFKLISRTEEDDILRKMNFYSTEIGGKIDAYSMDDSKQKEDFGYGTKIKINIPLQTMHLLQERESFGKELDYFGETNIYIEKIEETVNQVTGSFGIPVSVNTDKEFRSREKYLSRCFGMYFVDLSEEKIVKVVECKKKYKKNKYLGFSCWCPKEKLMIRYRWPEKLEESSSVKIYFNEIFVNDKRLNQNLNIPFFDTEIYIFDENAENFLEVHRDSFLYEKRRDIADIVSGAHLRCLRFLLTELENTEDQNMVQQQRYKNDIWTEGCFNDGVYCRSAKEYYQLVLRKEKITSINPDICFFVQYNDLITRIDESGFVDFSNIHMDQELWLTNTRDRYIGNVRLSRGDACEIRYIVEDAFFCYMQLAITELLCMIDVYGDYIIIYKTEQRSELPIQISKRHFKAYIRMKYAELNSETEKTKRMLLPGIQEYGPICVCKLQDNLGSTFEKKWNCAIIMPITVEELDELKNKESEADAMELIDTVYLTEKNFAYPKVVNYIETYGIRRNNTKDHINVAYRALLLYIWQLLI